MCLDLRSFDQNRPNPRSYEVPDAADAYVLALCKKASLPALPNYSNKLTYSLNLLTRWSKNMKRPFKLLGAAGVALLCVSPASAQESDNLSAEFLKQASPLIHWPKGLEPRNVDVFVHNEGSVDTPAEVVWQNLIEASKWPTWYSNSVDVQIQCRHDKLEKGVSFSWKTFGFPIVSRVDTFTPNREIGW